jgi:hypothetical protein
MGKPTSRSPRVVRKRCRVYGPFPGGDPGHFRPDRSASEPVEICAHAEACRMWDDAEKRGTTPNPEDYPEGWHKHDGANHSGHVLSDSYGVGWYTYEVIERPPDLPGQQTMLFEGPP